MATKQRAVSFKDPDQFLKFCRLYFERQAVQTAAQQVQAQLVQRVQDLGQELAAVAKYEGLPLTLPLEFDAARARVTWDEPQGGSGAGGK